MKGHAPCIDPGVLIRETTSCVRSGWFVGIPLSLELIGMVMKVGFERMECCGAANKVE